MLAHDDEQLAAGSASAERVSSLYGRTVATRIERLDRFWMAEDYHQKYYLRNARAVARELHAAYPGDDDAFVASTAAMRANGYLHGGASCTRLERELPGLGLSEDAAAVLRSRCR